MGREEHAGWCLMRSGLSLETLFNKIHVHMNLKRAFNDNIACK